MPKVYTIDIDDLNDSGLLAYASIALQSTLTAFDDWSIFGPTIERFRIDLSYLDSPTTTRCRFSTGERINEPWSAAISNADGDFCQWGQTPQRAITRVIIEAYMKGEELNIPQDEVEKFLANPELVDYGELD